MRGKAEAAPLQTTTPSGDTLGFIRCAVSRRVFKRNLLISLLVGTLLTLANQFDVILRGPVRANLLAKISLNFVIPFVVSSVSAYANRCGP
jgi:hypothetical protein